MAKQPQTDLEKSWDAGLYADNWIDPLDKPDPILDDPFTHSLGRELAEIDRLSREENG